MGFALAAALAAGGWLIAREAVHRHVPAVPEETPSTRATLARRDKAALVSIRVARDEDGGAAYTFVPTGDGLGLVAGESAGAGDALGGVESNAAAPRAVRSIVADAMLDAVLEVAAVDTLGDDAPVTADDLAQMGLSPADLVVTAAYSDGTVDTFEVGGGVPLTAYSYMKFSSAGENGDGSASGSATSADGASASGGGLVYIVDPGMRDAFSWDASLLTPVPDVRVVASLVSDIALWDGAEADGTATASGAEAGGTATASGAEADGTATASGAEATNAAASPAATLAFSRASDGTVSAALTAPYRYPVDAEAAARLLTAVGSLRLGVYVGDATPETLRACGLDTPRRTVVVTQAAGSAGDVAADGAFVSTAYPQARYTFAFGANADGARVYTRYEDAVYLVSRLLVEPLLTETASSLASRTPADVGADAVREITATRGGVTTRFTRSEVIRRDADGAAVLGEDGDFETETVAARDGAAWSTDAFSMLAAKLCALTAEGELSDVQRAQVADATAATPATNADATETFRVTLTTSDGTTRVLTGIRLDAFRDALGVDGVFLHTIISETVTAALGAGR